jgi:single-stranded DNA-binding protein
VVLTGKVSADPKLSYSATATPECRLTLVVEEGKGEHTFSLFVPIFVYGAGAERVAEDINAGDLIAINDRLSWKSTLKKDGTKLGLCVTCFSVEVLVKVAEPVAAGAVDPKPELAPAPKKGKPRYPRWQPEPGVSKN